MDGAVIRSYLEQYHAMDMTFWLPQAKAVRAHVDGACEMRRVCRRSYLTWFATPGDPEGVLPNDL